LGGFSKLYGEGIVPYPRDGFDIDLFNTYRSFLYPDGFPIVVDRHSDERGDLFEAIKTFQGGQCFVSSTHPGITRGNHYHLHKFERFMVINGDAVIRLRRLLRDDIIEYRVSGENPCFVDMPVLYTHNITNIGKDDLWTLFWANELYDPASPDTYPEEV
jgi:UDP-2-acetamido-2,6-beta-L-arabino-hexul-4-ose reductase